MANPILRYCGRIKAGRLPKQISAAIARVLGQSEDRLIEVSIREIKKKRSNNQNEYYWSVVIPFVVQILYDYGNLADTEMAHEVCKRLFLPPSGRKRVFLKTGLVAEHRTTTGLSTKEFEEYLEAIRAWLAEQEVICPLPNEGEHDQKERTSRK
jgi:hypothetical protein